MSGFKFEFEPLLNLKIQLENNQKNELGKSIKIHELEKHTLDGLFKKKNLLTNKINESVKGLITINELKVFNNYFQYLKNSIDMQKEVVNEAARNVDIEREKLVDCTKERKKYDKLKEHKQHEFLEEMKKKEQKIIDEIISFRQVERENGKSQELRSEEPKQG